MDKLPFQVSRVMREVMFKATARRADGRYGGIPLVWLPVAIKSYVVFFEENKKK